MKFRVQKLQLEYTYMSGMLTTTRNNAIFICYKVKTEE